MKHFKIGFALLEYFYFDVDPISEMHLNAHNVKNEVYDRKMVVSLIILYSPN